MGPFPIWRLHATLPAGAAMRGSEIFNKWLSAITLFEMALLMWNEKVSGFFARPPFPARYVDFFVFLFSVSQQSCCFNVHKLSPLGLTLWVRLALERGWLHCLFNKGSPAFCCLHDRRLAFSLMSSSDMTQRQTDSVAQLLRVLAATFDVFVHHRETAGCPSWLKPSVLWCASEKECGVC